MRLFYENTDVEVTGINFEHVRKVINTGGSMAFTKRDINLAGIATAKSLMNQQVEVRKADGTTVIWEGFLEKIPTYTDKKFLMTGNEPLAILKDVSCKYNSLAGEGTVITAVDDYITDTALTTDATMHGKVVGFHDVDDTSINYGTYFCNSNTVFFNGGVAPDTATGTYADVIGGKTGMYLADANERANDYYGIDVKITISNGATADWIIITIDTMYNARTYYDATEEPLIEIYNFNTPGWEVADNSNVTGIGRLNAAAGGWGATANTKIRTHIHIKANIAHYLSTNEVYVKLTAGKTNTSPSVEIIELLAAYATSYVRGSATANATTYTIDNSDTNKLIFTGQTPAADGVAVNDSYKIGVFLHTAAANIWKYAPVTMCDLTFDATTLFEGVDRRTSKVTPTLLEYASRLNRILYQKVGWDIECKTSLTSSGVELTEVDLDTWHLSIDSETNVAMTTSFARRLAFKESIHRKGTYTQRDDIRPLWEINTPQIATEMLPNIITLFQDFTILLTIRVNLDGAAPGGAGAWADVDTGKTITVNLYSGQLTVTDGTIREISYYQSVGSDLHADIVIEV